MNKTYEALSVLGKLSSLYIDRVFADSDINSSHQSFIVVICAYPCIKQDQLAEKVHLNPSNVTRAVEKLIKTGYIIKKRCTDDLRTFCLFPTQKAYKMRDKIREAESAWIDLITGALDDKEILRLEAYLEIMKNTATEYME